ncbi:unnamed protein product [Taenia asiatica]|uniref:Uncharacterized protein n=1 Tax=Taenia asiatica TaxID=60517 RepID=A0A0R3WAA9_TAEAS|nr:unnamed protein product [Taenia asiatica]
MQSSSLYWIAGNLQRTSLFTWWIASKLKPPKQHDDDDGSSSLGYAKAMAPIPGKPIQHLEMRSAVDVVQFDAPPLLARGQGLRRRRFLLLLLLLLLFSISLSLALSF